MRPAPAALVQICVAADTFGDQVAALLRHHVVHQDDVKRREFELSAFEHRHTCLAIGRLGDKGAIALKLRLKMVRLSSI
jgi:hypothetical protein